MIRYHVALYYSTFADTPEDAARLALEAVKHGPGITIEVETDGSDVLWQGDSGQILESA